MAALAAVPVIVDKKAMNKRNPAVSKTEAELDAMRRGGKILQAAHQAARQLAVPGAKLTELDAAAEAVIVEAGGIPAFKGYHGFPATLCTMVNSEVVHGIPDDRELKAGDILSVDCGVIFEDLITDAAFTVIVGGAETNPKRAQFSEAVYAALQAGCRVAKTGNRLGDIGYAIESHIKQAGYTVIKDFTGHGVGYDMHEDPYVLNYGKPGTGQILTEGMTICIEPIIAMGKSEYKTLSDGWTVVTLDGQDACQWEHCGVVTKDGLEIFA